MPILSIVKCDDYKNSQKAVEKAVELLGKIEFFIKPSEKIHIKPNLLSPKDPSKAVTTHPEIVRSIIKLVKKAGATAVVGDSPGGAIRDIKNLWKVTQIEQVCKEENVELVNFEAVGSKEFDIGNKNIKKVNFSNAVLDCDGIINLPKLKSHSLMTFTAGVKNLYGCIPGLMKIEYHKYASKNQDFADLLTHIYLFFKNKLRFTLIDGILAMEGNGPSAGQIRKMDLIAACQDAAIIDAYLLNALGYDLKNSLISKNLNITQKTLETVKTVGDKIEAFDLKNFKFPALRKLDILPNFVVRFLGKLLWVKAGVDKKICIKCMLCKSACPAKAITQSKTLFPVMSKQKCISCFCCHEMCPKKAVVFRKSLFAKFFIREN
ncbi:MAG: DUF362 domain-containing protein [Elusimicrobiota bacterium]|jgi:uncharacterized protein (DUF362 family)/Pyruvate/2-oxoacid:ferredoxin oxidoreductase delta subunit|nr:DUF362 domain-containing protein [Elusimicrobiota bacterium]